MPDQRSDQRHAYEPPSSGRALASRPPVTVLDKPLPSPNAWCRVQLAATHIRVSTKRFTRRYTPSWLAYSGWRTTIMGGAGASVIVLITNVALLIWSQTRPMDDTTNQRLIATTECGTSQTIFTYFQLLINVLSTLLLGASNATMQCLSAPTREAIDCAHAQGQCLDVGISGFRNWKWMDTWRKCCWMLLALSSIPLHLMYNSAVFQTTAANEYYAILAKPELFQNGSYQMQNVSVIPGTLYPDQSFIIDLVANASEVTKPGNATNNTDLIQYAYQQTMPVYGESGSVSADVQWMCGMRQTGATCDYNSVINDSGDWTILTSIFGDWEYFAIDYCLAQETGSFCSVQIMPEIMALVVIFNIVQAICLLYTANAHNFIPLITLGDGLASFLAHPDPHTADFGPLAANDLRTMSLTPRKRRALWNRKRSSPDADSDSARRSRSRQPLKLKSGPLTSRPLYWFSGASSLRWGLAYLWLTLIWLCNWAAMEFTLLYEGGQSGIASLLLKSGFGIVSPDLLLEGSSGLGLIGNTLLANLPQVILSLVYVSYNALFTCMLLSHEFTMYARRRAGLRVSMPIGRYQRTSYWLSVPYKYSIPLLAFSGVLHWALSQTLFVAQVKVMSPTGSYDSSHAVSCLGYSSLGITVLLGLITVMLGAPLALGFRKYPCGAPLVESYSLAISAACHSNNSGVSEAGSLLKYGIISGNEDSRTVGLSSGPVVPLLASEHCNRATDENPPLETSTAKELQPQSTRIIRIVLRLFNTGRFIVVGTYTGLMANFIWQGIGESANIYSGPGLRAFVYWLEGAQLNPEPVVVLLGICSLAYLLIRALVSVVRRRVGAEARRHAWIFAVELMFCAGWIAAFASAVSAQQDITVLYAEESIEGVPIYGYNTAPANPYVGFTAAVMPMSVLTMFGEGWMWWNACRGRPQSQTFA